MFPEPRQNSVEAMAGNKDYIRDIPHETLVVHGREDRVIPVETSLELSKTIKNSELHIFGKCGHWTQIEQTQRFADTVKSFIEK